MARVMARPERMPAYQVPAGIVIYLGWWWANAAPGRRPWGYPVPVQGAAEQCETGTLEAVQ